MGRLTLNMLLSFAQFEREVTAERIRDKIAASKAKGMWMGGLWDEVQKALADHCQGGPREAYRQTNSLLAGKVVDEAGQPLIPTHSSRPRRDGTEGRKRYSYYVSRALHHRDSSTGMRIPAREVEALVVEQLAAAFDDPLNLVAQAQLAISASEFAVVAAKATLIAAEVRAKDRARIRDLVSQVQVLPGAVEMRCDTASIAVALGTEIGDDGPPSLTLRAPVRLTRSGMAMRLIQGGAHAAAPPDRALVRLVVQARGLWLELRKGERNITELAEAVKLSPAYITRVLRLAFLSPAMVDAILAGKQPAGVTAYTLSQAGAVPPLWTEQARIGKA
jgi:site-specific DNA recombinase